MKSITVDLVLIFIGILIIKYNYKRPISSLISITLNVYIAGVIFILFGVISLLQDMHYIN